MSYDALRRVDRLLACPDNASLTPLSVDVEVTRLDDLRPARGLFLDGAGKSVRRIAYRLHAELLEAPAHLGRLQNLGRIPMYFLDHVRRRSLRYHEAEPAEVLEPRQGLRQRDGRTVTLMRFEIAAWAEYREIFGRSASDNVLRQVGRTIATVTKRASDVVARTAGDEFLVLGVSMEAAAALGFAEQILGRIRSLSVHHPRSGSGRFLTVSAGVVTCSPPRDRGPDVLVVATQNALHLARSAGGNRAVRGEV